MPESYVSQSTNQILPDFQIYGAQDFILFSTLSDTLEGRNKEIYFRGSISQGKVQLSINSWCVQKVQLSWMSVTKKHNEFFF